MMRYLLGGHVGYYDVMKMTDQYGLVAYGALNITFGLGNKPPYITV